MKNIKLLLIGNPNTSSIIGTFPDKEKDINKNFLNEGKQIFERYCQSESISIDIRSKISSKDGNYYFTINSSNIFYLILVDDSWTERDVFTLFEDIQKDNIPWLVDTTTQKLNLVGRQQLKIWIENYNGNNKINQINIELKDTQELMKNNIKDLTKNVDDIGNLEQKAVKIKEGASDYNKNAVKLERATCWQNCKWTIIIVLVVIWLILIIVPTSVYASRKKDD